MSSEFDRLQSLSQTVIHDLKSTNCNWEALGSRASKLATQLNNTAVCLSNFVDCLQALSDAANGVKGASRDVGAALTRFCLRQRNLQSDLKAVATAISDGFNTTLDRRAAEWKSQVAELERRQHKIGKRRRAKKEMQSEVLSEQKTFCIDVLLGQRQVFTGFINLLLPKAEMHLLEEGMHTKEVQEAIEMEILMADPAILAKEALEDAVADNEEQAWRRRLPSPSRSTVSSKHSRQNVNVGPSSSPSTSSFYNWAGEDTRTMRSSKGSLHSGKASFSNQRSFHSSDQAHSKPPFPVKHSDSGYNVTLSGALSVSASDISIAGFNNSAIFAGASNQSTNLHEDLGSVCLSNEVDSGRSEENDGSIRHRHPSVACAPPPPPQRRNSSITAATAAAPSVVDLRSAFAAQGRVSFGNAAELADHLPEPQHNSLFWHNTESERNIYYTK